MSVSSSSSSTSSSLNPTVVDYGLVSGLNTSSIIQAELQPFEQPVTNLTNQQSTINSNVSDYQQINTDLVALKSAADALSGPSGWTARQATPSDSTVATATASAGTPTGSIQFSVLQLAAANSIVSTGNVASTSQIVTSSSGFLLSQGGGQLGLASLASGSGLALGSHTISVTQSSAAAAATGTTVLSSQASGITIGSTSNSINVTVDNQSYTLSLAASPTGGYSGSALLSAVQSAITSAGAGGVLQAGYDSAGHLVLSTLDQGSSQTLQVTGGTALSALGLATQAQAAEGTDAVVSVDGTDNTLSDVTAGSTVTLNGANGATVQATLASLTSTQAGGGSLLSDGSLTATQVSTGNGSLSALVSNINAAGTGITASAVQVSANQYVLQLTSSNTGAAADLSVDTSAFSSSALGALKTASAGQDAQIQVGGAGGYTVSSGTNDFSGLLPGLSVTAEKVSSSPITVSVTDDTSAVSASVQHLVTAANTVLSDIQTYAGYNASSKTAGPLMGSAVLQNLTAAVQSLFATTGGTSGLANAVNAGITLSNGQVNFDQSTFEAAYNANPTQVQNLFTSGGTFAANSSANAGQVVFSYASSTTKSGSYDVNISQSAAQALDTGSVLSGGTVSTAENLSIAMGGATTTFATSAGESLDSIAQGLNSAFAAGGMQLSAQVVNGNQLELRSDAYGSAASFTVSSSSTGAGTLGLTGSGSSLTASGADVAGTINGVAATGFGQFLTAPSSDPTLGGLSLQVTATGITSATDLGTFTYTPGLAQVLSNESDAMSNPATGTITGTIKGLQSQSTNLTSQISYYNSLVQQEQKMLMNRYANLEETLGNIKDQSSSLSSELSQLAAS